MPNSNKNENLFIKLLKSEYSKRRAKNQRYSLRSFALFLGIPVSTLKHVMEGDRPPSSTNFRKIASRLQWAPDILRDVTADLKKRKDSRKIQLEQMKTFVLPEDLIMSDIATLAIRRLADLKRIPFEARHIAKLLGISIKRARTSLEILLNSEMIKNHEDLLYPGSRHAAHFAQTPPNPKFRRYLLNQLEHAKRKLMKADEKHVRFTFYFLASPKDIKKLILKTNAFQRDLRENQTLDQTSELYSGIISLVPFN